MKRSIVVTIISNLFILLFLYTGIMKFFEHDIFMQALLKSTALKRFALPISIIIPVLELFTVSSLMIPRLKRLGLWMAFALMLMFTLYVGLMLQFDLHKPCSCGGIIRYMNWHQHLYFNTAFTLLALLALLLDKNKISIELNKKIYA